MSLKDNGACSDCGAPARAMNASTCRRGSKVREPGELLCAGCSSRRVLMVRAVDKLPDDITIIRAMRMERFTK